MSFWKKIKKGVSDTTNTVVNTAVNTTNTVVNTTNTVVDTAVNTTTTVVNTVVNTTNTVVNDTVKVTEKTTNDLKNGVCNVNNSVDAAVINLKHDINKIDSESKNALAKTNNVVLKPVGKAVVNTAKQTSEALGDAGEIFLAGAIIVGEGLQEGGEFIVEAAEEVAEWVDENACEIGMGLAFATVFGAMLYRPEPASIAETSATMAPLSATAIAYIAAKEIGEEAIMGAIIGVACDLTATAFVDLIWQIPEVKKGVGNKNKDILTSAISFTIAKSLDVYAGAYIIPQSGAAVICGIVGSMATRLICSGTVPKNWRDWTETASAGA